MPLIEKVSARKILDSRGKYTIEVTVHSKDLKAIACSPSGASVGKFEAQAFPKEGVERSVQLLQNQLSSKIKGKEAKEQTEIDRIIWDFDGTKNLSKLGGNAAIATSIAVAKVASKDRNLMLCQYLGSNLNLPFPLSNIIGGGVHTKGDSIDFQEFLALPLGAKTFEEAAQTNVMIHSTVAEIIMKKYPKYVLGRNDEGAWAAPLTINETLETLTKAIEKVEKEIGVRAKIGIDAAASELWDSKNEEYVYRKENRRLSSEQQLEYLLELIEKYEIAYFEDPFQEEDFDYFAKLTANTKNRCMIIGDDLIVTNKNRLETAVEKNAVTGVIIKPNQVGTLTDTNSTAKLCHESKVIPAASHRSGETTDPALAHIAVGLKCPIIKIGTMGGERMAKINELIRMENSLKIKMSKLPMKK
ncbi:MAG: phosphopyruvate hydratase [Candidatus Jordarchaeum sp.]|uniref:phosphopyruvate hydratase n=1 Tax=Candidatus Jordarchaeum sp. TaxID=2823881 RepID=UPI004049834D